MNIILFERGELPGFFPLQDPRSHHILEILHLQVGDRFLAGIVDSQHGTAALLNVSNEGLTLGDEVLDGSPPPLSRVRMLIGTPRPPTARRLLKDLTTLGVAEIHFVATKLGDRNYLKSSLWDSEWRSALKEGASQNRTTRLPVVERHEHLGAWLDQHPQPGVRFDVGARSWSDHPRIRDSAQLWLAIGPERGWTDAERLRFDGAGWSVASLGPSVLRTETACTLALGSARMFEANSS